METLYSGHGWTVTKGPAPLPNGKIKDVARIGRSDTVHVIARESDGRILIQKEFRPYYGTHIWMLPGGRADKESDLEEAADRELREESGMKAGRLRLLWTVHHSESMDFANHYFFGEDLTEDPLPQDDDELIELHRVLPTEALKLVEESAKIHLPSAYGIRRFIDEGI